jgi:hypothetical protein
MLNSQNYHRDENVIQIGETIASEVDYKDPNVKVYYHRIKGAQTHMPDGAAIDSLVECLPPRIKRLKPS